MMPDYRLSYKAESDLDEIWLYTYETWSFEQAEFYIDGLLDCLDSLAEHPEAGQVDYLRQGYRRYSYRKHYIFYKVIRDSIEIIRVLHQSRDIKRHL